VGQSSWGPTLFAVFADQQMAVDFLLLCRQRVDGHDLELTLSEPDNCGARIEIMEDAAA
jgi:predicted sugar kinase